MTDKQKAKGSEVKLRQTNMGNYMSPASSREKSSESKKRKVQTTASKMMTSFWTWGSERDTEQYRSGYPHKKDNPNLNKNQLFYFNQQSSSPDGDFIDTIHRNWKGDYARLERHHGYIQWIFPIREDGMNWQAQELQPHEAKAIQEDEKASRRVLESYKMMLDFYGMELKNPKTGEIARAENWKSRFQHLNRSYHNYLRITRILKSLGELGYEHLKFELVKFFLVEALAEGTLDNLFDSCNKYWIGVVKDDGEREALEKLRDKLLEEQEEKERIARKKKGKEVKNWKNQEQDDVHFSSDFDSSEVKAIKRDHEMSASDNSDSDNNSGENRSNSAAGGESQEAKYWDESSGKAAGKGKIPDWEEDLGSDTGVERPVGGINTVRGDKPKNGPTDKREPRTEEKIEVVDDDRKKSAGTNGENIVTQSRIEDTRESANTKTKGAGQNSEGSLTLTDKDLGTREELQGQASTLQAKTDDRDTMDVDECRKTEEGSENAETGTSSRVSTETSASATVRGNTVEPMETDDMCKDVCRDGETESHDTHL